MGDIIRQLLDAILGLRGVVAYTVVAALAFGETAIFADVVVPGEVGMVLAGVLAAHGNVQLWVTIAVASLGAALGDSFSYYVGRRWGMDLIRRWEFVRRRLEPEVERAHDLFERRGGLAIFLGRFFGPLRAVVPVAAGISGMPYGDFLPWNVAASIAWTGTVIGIGYVFGRSIVDFVRQTADVLLWVVLGLVAVWVVVRWLQRHPERLPETGPLGRLRSRLED